MKKMMKRVFAILTAVLVLGTAAPVMAAPAQDGGTIMWLSHLTSGVQFDATVNYLTAICDELGYNFTVVYADPMNDAANNLLAVQNGMTGDVKGLIVSQDGGLQSIMEAYPELFVIGYCTDMRSVYNEGENAACLENDKFLGTICDGYADGTQKGIDYANAVIEKGYKKVSIVNFPPFAYPDQTEADISFRAAIEEYNKDAEEPVEILGETTTLMFQPLPTSWFLEEGRNDLDCIVSLCNGVLFVYPIMVSAKGNGTCAADTKLITGGFESDADIVADIGDEGTITWNQFSPAENPAYSLIILDDAITGTLPSDFEALRVDGAPYTIDSTEDIQNVMTKSLLGTADPALAHISVEDVVGMCGRSNPEMTQAEIIEQFQSINVDQLK